MAAKKSQDAKFQLHVWSRLLEGRIALQKVVLASRDIEKRISDDESKVSLDEATVKSVTKLLASLVRLRDSYRKRSQFSLNTDNEIDSTDEDPEAYANIDDTFLEDRHASYNGVRNGIIEKWCEKTKIGTIPKKGYAALELPTLQLINIALKDKERLIRRTQLNRTSHLDNDMHPETFNDDDFYHHLLKEIISKEEGRKWVELQRLKYKNKRKADTKATKGRKVRKDLIPKLVNFMAPSRPTNQHGGEVVSDQIRRELMKSIFGGSIKTNVNVNQM